MYLDRTFFLKKIILYINIRWYRKYTPTSTLMTKLSSPPHVTKYFNTVKITFFFLIFGNLFYRTSKRVFVAYTFITLPKPANRSIAHQLLNLRSCREDNPEFFYREN